MPQARRLGSSRAATFIAAVLLPCVLSGCPLTDDYFLDRGHAGNLAVGGDTGAVAGTSGTGAGLAGSSGSETGGTDTAGSGGSSGTGAFMTGGVTAIGGTGGIGGTDSGGVAGAGSAQGGVGSGATGGDAGEPNAGAGGEPPECVPSAEVCDGTSNDCDEEIDEDDVCPTGCSARTYGEQTYFLCMSASPSSQLNYSDASLRCEALGAELGLDVETALARIESVGENDFIKSWIVETAPATGMVWMGANDLDEERTWVWGRGRGAERFFDQAVGGSGVAYEDRFHDFAEGRPNSANNVDEDCAALDSDVSWQWNDLKCSDVRLGYLCEPIADWRGWDGFR